MEDLALFLALVITGIAVFIWLVLWLDMWMVTGQWPRLPTIEMLSQQFATRTPTENV